MRRSWLLLLNVLLISGSINAYAEVQASFVRREYSEDTRDRSGECDLIKSSVLIEDNIVHTTFEIDVPSTGVYFISAWISHHTFEGKNLDAVISIDGNKTTVGRLFFQGTGWQSAPVCELEGGGNH